MPLSRHTNHYNISAIRAERRVKSLSRNQRDHVCTQDRTLGKASPNGLSELLFFRSPAFEVSQYRHRTALFAALSDPLPGLRLSILREYH